MSFVVVPGPMFSCSEMIWSLSSVRTSNSLGTVPELVMVKVTTPEGKDVDESLQESSVRVTVISWALPDPEAPPLAFLGLSAQAARPSPMAVRGSMASTLRRLMVGICLSFTKKRWWIRGGSGSVEAVRRLDGVDGGLRAGVDLLDAVLLARRGPPPHDLEGEQHEGRHDVEAPAQHLQHGGWRLSWNMASSST